MQFFTCMIPFIKSTAQNIVPNPGFEDVNICTEYHAPCAPSAWESTAPHISKIIYKEDKGQHYLTLTTQSRINPDFRSYCQTTLLCPLQQGQTYTLRMYTRNNHDELPLTDIRFDTAAVFRNATSMLNLKPSLQLTSKNIAGQYHNWTILEKTFVADKNATHLIIGNFQRKTHPAKGESYLYLDSVTITPLSGKICADADSIKAQLYAYHNRHSFYLTSSPTEEAYTRMPARAPLPQAVFQRSGQCDTLLLKSDFFLPHSKNINPSYVGQLDKMLKVAHNDVRNKIGLTGYAHRSANKKYNEIIAQDRANEVAKYFVYQQGYSFDDFTIAGADGTAPDGDTSELVMLVSCQPAPEVTVPDIRTDTLIIPDLLFKVNSSELNVHMLLSMDSLISKIPVNDSIAVSVTGHTDNTGTGEYNQELSMRRAGTVADYIRNKKPGAVISEVNGMGESMPVADNNTVEGRRKNRRVEIVLYYLPKKN
ncbi:OmpA family protein [Chitinophaga sp. MM2321]|uniref:OmpA family protein n=1 Tax=Chitinophaga sp. MM2321 TaxID=3137178 RepID=UPI0032D5B10A